MFSLPPPPLGSPSPSAGLPLPLRRRTPPSPSTTARGCWPETAPAGGEAFQTAAADEHAFQAAASAAEAFQTAASTAEAAIEAAYLDLLKNLKRHKDEDAIKGQAVKNQKALWDNTLEFRFLLQKPFSSSNKLPQEPVKSSFCSSDKVVDQAYADLVSSCKQTLDFMLELQEALLEQNHSIVESTAGNTKQSSKDGLLPNELKGEADEDWLQIHEMQSRIAPFRNNAVDKWHRKTQVTTGAAAFKGKLHAFNQNISDQVAGYMRDPSRMIKRMQLGSFSVGIFGKVPENSESIKEEDVNVEGDPELLDDSEFYQQLLKEFFESCDLTSSVMAFHAMKKLQPKKRKIVDRRASKSRKIRYSVHEKIVNFMAPVPMNLPQMAPKLFENLFGMGNQKASSVLQPAAVGMS